MSLLIPQNTKKAVLEIYVSSHGNDEFWYSNPPNSYIEQNNLTTQRGNGAFRQVFATVDGVTVGSATPFPVSYTGGINPLFWEPVVAIGAFNLPTYDFDLTPFLGFLLDGKNHSFGLGVTDSISFWLVSYLTPPIEFKIKSKADGLDGKFKIKGKREIEYSGWVNSSAGNFTTPITEKFKFKNKIKIKNYGQENQVKQKIKVKTEIIVENEIGQEISKLSISRKYPLKIKISTLPGADKDTFLSITNVSHSLEETYTSRSLSSNEGVEISVENSQDSGGWMLVKDHSVIWGTGSTAQTYSYQDQNGHYSRVVYAANGKILQDNSTLTSASSSFSA
ncbi:peptide-N4-(N-acetyl-beta-glucosaminyl)asparagine amidase A-like [Papaver somniferum]|uniref:peptide-N4-(N-acetyl-beta- glucosaminyl)asparagine amidase A-like n=1 Tax=Papaver somniferum TaxID=3469 RepID=UPI000E6F73B4|nr:peptide-N4-(N-acetyl-beta-glucosaminyl)asparagine amidase A-like [Papaver somniferum]